ncbi:serine/threonine-protein phosphatase 2B regulatory subunit [Nematocida major]|uniref:serine/threonine-protein phosphatase 2B regulatory subunit n=1 Tax=Nematocida major TaxID=1912982 RepID=UPI0020073E64|nr:serine/threonine-protein phosphatase 2B regulatory subunit [Nematocida major]KAH9385672.1 serine/threonine-protein phosphatase 2B regulatory subunit [Nematocida major]
MGSVFSGLTKEDIQAVKKEGCKLPQEEIKKLYIRFKELDKEEIGRIYMDQLLCIPEISINPMGERVIRKICDKEGKIDFNGFIRAATLFSKYGTNEEKVTFFFDMIAENGKLTKEALQDLSSDLYTHESESEGIKAGIEEVFRVYGKDKKPFIECADLKGMDCGALGNIL